MAVSIFVLIRSYFGQLHVVLHCAGRHTLSIKDIRREPCPTALEAYSSLPSVNTAQVFVINYQSDTPKRQIYCLTETPHPDMSRNTLIDLEGMIPDSTWAVGIRQTCLKSCKLNNHLKSWTLACRMLLAFVSSHQRQGSFAGRTKELYLPLLCN